MKTFLCSYWYGGSKWQCELQADSLHEANLRLIAIATTGRIDGELMATIPVPRWYGKIVEWWKS